MTLRLKWVLWPPESHCLVWEATVVDLSLARMEVQETAEPPASQPSPRAADPLSRPWVPPGPTSILETPHVCCVPHVCGLDHDL